METLVRDPESPETTPENAAQEASEQAQSAPEQPPVERPCPTCGAALEADQEWCLECGTATPAARERSGLPGWRTAAAVIAVTLVMASGAVAAAYAAIRGDGSGDSPDSGALVLADTQTGPGVPTPPPIDIPAEEFGAAPPPSEEAPPAAAPPAAEAPVAPPAAVTPPPVAETPVAPPPVTDPPVDSGGNGTGNGDNTGDGAEKEQPDPITRAAFVPVELDPATTAATSFNPVVPGTTDPNASGTTDPNATGTTPAPGPAAGGTPAHADTDFTGTPQMAFDGDPATSWSVALGTPELLAEPQAGLLIDLAKPTKLRRLTITPTTPGTTIEVYGSKAATAPASLDDQGWKVLATQLDVDGKTKITLGEDGVGTGKIRHLLVYFADGPDDGTSTSVGISELELFS